MPKKGVTNNPKGRPVGAKGKSTQAAREAIAMFVENNAERLVGWLDEMAVDSPKDAFTAFMSVVEYHIPKLQRSELTGKDGAELFRPKSLSEFYSNDADAKPKS